MKIVNIDRGNLHSFRTISGISVNVAVKMWMFMIIKNQGLTLSLEETFLEKP